MSAAGGVLAAEPHVPKSKVFGTCPGCRRVACGRGLSWVGIGFVGSGLGVVSDLAGLLGAVRVEGFGCRGFF